jgi:SAM-dependent methyltransferase
VTDYDRIRRDPLAHLDYFTEWGGHAWNRLTRIGIADYLGGSLDGQHVLELGFRYGRMSCLFALLGARVTALEIHPQFLEPARAEARRFSVDSQVEFVMYDGMPGNIPDGSYDVVFAKSVLVLVKDLPRFLSGLSQCLPAGARVVFVENGLGGPLLRLARRVKHRGGWDYTEADYFTTAHVDLVRSLFDIERLIRTRIPPIYLFCGTKR